LSEFLVRLTIPNIQPQGISADIIQNNGIYDSNRLKPNACGLCNGEQVIVDRYGFRACHIPIDPKKRSWLLLGDSVTMGVGAHSDSTFAAHLQSRLDSGNNLNSGVIGYSYHDYHNLVRYFIEAQNTELQINRAILFFCLNDIYHIMADIRQPGGKLRFVFGGMLNFLRGHSRLYMFLKNLTSDRARSYYLFDEQFYIEENEHFQKSITALAEIQTILAQKNIPFDMVILPYEYQLRTEYQPAIIPQEFLMEYLKRERISVYNPFEYFIRNKTDSKEFYLYADGIHFSNRGHEIVANFVLDHVLNPQR
jgi:lysophospholipase L1-like esterase